MGDVRGAPRAHHRGRHGHHGRFGARVRIILGGRAPEYLRNDASLLSLVREFAEQDKCICAIGHGVQVLTAAGITRGRTMTCHSHVRIEVERSGAVYSNKPAVRDGRMITAQTWKAHPEFYREVFACLS
jgi:protease I